MAAAKEAGVSLLHCMHACIVVVVVVVVVVHVVVFVVCALPACMHASLNLHYPCKNQCQKLANPSLSKCPFAI